MGRAYGDSRTPELVGAKMSKFDANACASALADMLQSWQTYFKYSIHYIGSSLDAHAPAAGDAEGEPEAEVHTDITTP